MGDAAYYARSLDWQLWLAKQKDAPCLDCGGKFPAFVMDFDHRYGVKKLFKIAAARMRKKSVVEAEIAKCDLVCSNCHRIRTHERKVHEMNKREWDMDTCGRNGENSEDSSL